MRNLAIAMSLVLVFFAFAGCGTGGEETTSTEEQTTETTEEVMEDVEETAEEVSEEATQTTEGVLQEAEETTEEVVEEIAETAEEVAEETEEVIEGESIGAKAGLSVNTSIARSNSAGDDAGLAEVNSDIVAVIIDSEGRITNCAIDSIQTKIQFTETGEITTPLDKKFVGKQELGEEYGMIEVSSINKAWYEQANALSAYVIGKTVEEIKGISINEEGVPTEAELTSAVTMHIADYLAGIEEAAETATANGVSADDQLGIGVKSTIERSKNATSEEDGVAQAYAKFALVTLDEGVISSCIIDSSQGEVKFNQEGEITSDLSAEIKTKKEAGESYGMKSVSEIGKEWYEQAEALEAYVIGKTLEEVSGISLNEEGVPTDSELTSSVTISISPYISVIEEAYNRAK